MPQNLLAIHGVVGLVVAVGEGGKILHFVGDHYIPRTVESPTKATLNAVWVESPTSAWAVGEGDILRWNGTEWYRVALAPEQQRMLTVWGFPGDVWIGGTSSLINYRQSGAGCYVSTTQEIRGIWGSSIDDLWCLCSGRTVMTWCGDYCEGDMLPGDEDQEWNFITGSTADAPVYMVGPSGICMEWDRRRWWEFSSDTGALLMAACTRGPDDLWVVSSNGQVRQWDGRRWRTVAFSAFGPLYGICHVDGVIWACGARGVVLQHQPQPQDGGHE